jgi:hypothetical protein
VANHPTRTDESSKAGKPEEQKVQGEGDYEATRRYRQRQEDFQQNNDVEKAAQDAAPENAAEAEDLKAAEAQAKSRAKGEDPALRRRESPKSEPSTRGKASRH